MDRYKLKNSFNSHFFVIFASKTGAKMQNVKRDFDQQLEWAASRPNLWESSLVVTKEPWSNG